METQLPGSSGLLGSLREFADGLIGSVQDRVELFSVELQEEKHRLVQTFIWASAVVVLGLLTLGCASLAVVVIFWETARVGVAVGLTFAYLAAFAAAVFGFKRFLKRQPRPFACTLSELREDRACMRTEN